VSVFKENGHQKTKQKIKVYLKLCQALKKEERYLVIGGDFNFYLDEFEMEQGRNGARAGAGAGPGGTRANTAARAGVEAGTEDGAGAGVLSSTHPKETGVNINKLICKRYECRVF
jgi:hypothetical protein